MSKAARLERELHQGLERAVRANEDLASDQASRRTERLLDCLCRERSSTVRETVEELARMRAGYQQISYDKALRQIVQASRKGGSAIDTVGGF